MPSLSELAACYQALGDGRVEVYEGQGPVLVTHPLTRAGMAMHTNDSVCPS